MRAIVQGTVVEKDRNEWSINGKSGVAYGLFVAGPGESARQAKRVRVSAEQFGTFSEGDVVELPVDIFANTVERGGVITGAKLSVTVLADYDHAAVGSHLSSVSSL